MSDKWQLPATAKKYSGFDWKILESQLKGTGLFLHLASSTTCIKHGQQESR